MKHEILTSIQGYDIPCLNQIRPKKTVIICHGFGSSKENPTAQFLQAELLKYDIGTFCFDFPHHGESKVSGDYLRLEHCLNDLKTVEEYILFNSPNTEIEYFASSFGAYMLLIYLATYDHTGKVAFLRSCACNMHNILLGFLNELHCPVISSDLDTSKDKIIMDEIYGRDFFITKGFLNDLKEHNIFDYYPIPSHRFQMIHGDADSVAPIDDANCFATKANIPITILPNAEHRLLEISELKQVIDSSVRFFTS